MMSTEIPTFTYEAFRATLETGQEVLVQIFRDLESGQVIDSQIAFRTAAYGSWGTPYQLEKL
jgi:alanyl-tRNA synthetase